MEPMATGIPGLDRVLRGGLRSRSVHMIGGLPGTGKTTLAQQVAYYQAKQGGRTLYLAALSETAERLVDHAAGFSFFDSSAVADRIYYVSLYPKLEEGGLPAVLEETRRLALDYRASLVCIDGLSTLKTAGSSILEFRRFVFDLNAQLHSLGATTLLIGPWLEWTASDPEFTVADGIINLSLRSSEHGARRHLEVLKLRGAEHLAGKHVVAITHDGISVFPRLEAVSSQDVVEQPSAQWTRRSTGAAELDQMLRGGIPSESSTLVTGVAGAGKTTLALSFLAAGGHQGERGIYLGFDEAPSRLVAKADLLSFGLGKMVEDGTAQVRRIPPFDLIPDHLAWELLRSVDDGGVRRVVIDGLDTLLAGLEGSGRTEAFLAALMFGLAGRNVTTIVTAELPRTGGTDLLGTYERIGVFDNVITLQYVELRSELHRLISILEVRESDFDPAIREFTISEGGLHVADTLGSAELGLTGIGHWRRRRAR